MLAGSRAFRQIRSPCSDRVSRRCCLAKRGRTRHTRGATTFPRPKRFPMKLYYSPGACSLAPHIMIREAGLPADIVKVDLGTKKTEKGEDFSKINPKGYVPTVQLDNGQVLTEVAVLLQYIADQKPEAKLIPPAGTLDRYREQEWLNFIATEVHKGFGPLWNPATPDSFKAIVKKKLGDRFALLDKHFSTNDFLMGKSFTA